MYNIYTSLHKVNKMCANDNLLQTASQNISHNESGAFTGEVSAQMVNSLNVKYTILGHSERRSRLWGGLGRWQQHAHWLSVVCRHSLTPSPAQAWEYHWVDEGEQESGDY